MKEFSKFEIASIKRTAQNVSAMMSKRNKLNEKIAKLTEERDKIQSSIDAWEAPIKVLSGGLTTEQLVDKVQVKTGVDKNGKDIMGYKFVMKEGIGEAETTQVDTNEPVDTGFPNNPNDLFPQREGSDDALNM
jgi:uncharacterized coiled-coil DUF342 family protein